jgi:hypothetical protein
MQAIQAWRDNSAFGRVQLVKQYFLCVEGAHPHPWQPPSIHKPSQHSGDRIHETGFRRQRAAPVLMHATINSSYLFWRHSFLVASCGCTRFKEPENSEIDADVADTMQLPPACCCCCCCRGRDTVACLSDCPRLSGKTVDRNAQGSESR